MDRHIVGRALFYPLQLIKKEKILPATDPKYHEQTVALEVINRYRPIKHRHDSGNARSAHQANQIACFVGVTGVKCGKTHWPKNIHLGF